MHTYWCAELGRALLPAQEGYQGICCCCKTSAWIGRERERFFQQSAQQDLASAELKMTLVITLTLGNLDFRFPRVLDRDACACCLGDGYMGTQRAGEGTGHYCKSHYSREKNLCCPLQ